MIEKEDVKFGYFTLKAVLFLFLKVYIFKVSFLLLSKFQEIKVLKILM